MKITGLSAQIRNPDRINVSIDGKYRLSLDISQIINLDIKVGRGVSEEELTLLESESQFGKLYARALEYALMRPRSVREIRDYLYRKTRTTKYKNRLGEIKERQGYPLELTERVLEKLQQKDHVDDERFARWWIDTRNQTKGSSLRKLRTELQAKGVSGSIIDEMIAESDRSDESELAKVIAKKRNRYQDNQKFIQYLSRQGFRYDDIKHALSEQDD